MRQISMSLSLPIGISQKRRRDDVSRQFIMSFKSLICFTFHRSNGNFILSWMLQVLKSHVLVVGLSWITTSSNQLLFLEVADIDFPGCVMFLRSKLRCQALPTRRSTYGETRFHMAETGPHVGGFSNGFCRVFCLGDLGVKRFQLFSEG